MLGAIFGDIVGSVYEFRNTHDYDFVLLRNYSEPTDDSYMTLAVAKALMESWGEDDEAIRTCLVEEMQRIARENHLTEDAAILESGALLHSVVGAHLARTRYGCEDAEIIAAILSHTTGKAGMSRLDMAVWLADTIEPTRAPYPLLDKTRMLAGLSLEKAMITSLEGTLQHVRKKGDAVHPATMETLTWLKTLPQ